MEYSIQADWKNNNNNIENWCATVEPNLDLSLDHDRLALKLYRRNLLIDLYRNFKPNLIYERLDSILS